MAVMTAKTVREVVVENPAATRVFERFGIDKEPRVGRVLLSNLGLDTIIGEESRCSFTSGLVRRTAVQ